MKLDFTRPDAPIPLFKVAMSEEAIEASVEVLRSGYIGQGPKVDEFEERIKKYIGHDHVVTTNSATSALHMAGKFLKKKSEPLRNTVLTTPLTCTATNWPFLANDLDLKWVDVDPKTMNMDLDDLARKLDNTVVGIVVVHWGGNPVDLDALYELVDRHEKLYNYRVNVVEDCAHAWGATYKDRSVGVRDSFGVFSFQAIKHLTSIDGGALCVPSLDDYNESKLMRWYGIDREGNRKDFRCEADIKNWGFKFHMNDVSAAVGMANMNLAAENLEHNRELARYYDNYLSAAENVRPVTAQKDSVPAYWLYTIRVLNGKRDNLMRHLKEAGIASSRVHERNDKHTCVLKYRAMLPGLEQASKEMLCIPMGWWISEDDRKYIITTINKWDNNQ